VTFELHVIFELRYFDTKTVIYLSNFILYVVF
jgi:hypothetical protein